MHQAIQSFFVVQVAVERAASFITKTSEELSNEYLKKPLQRTLQELIGTEPPNEVEKLHSEIDSIRAELRGLRTDLRELQQNQSQPV